MRKFINHEEVVNFLKPESDLSKLFFITTGFWGPVDSTKTSGLKAV